MRPLWQTVETRRRGDIPRYPVPATRQGGGARFRLLGIWVGDEGDPVEAGDDAAGVAVEKGADV